MNLDLSQLDNLELDNIGQWPPLAKLILTIFVAVVVLALGYVFLVSDRIQQLGAAQQEELTLKQQYQSKYHVAANLELFQAQMEEAETLFANQLRSLPESHETPGLLDDITFVGTTSGLDFVNINWQPENSKEIYIELPIEMEVVGTYHQFGEFVSKIAGLPRIVTLHDFNIDMRSGPGREQLNLTMQAKTYRYREAASE